MSNSSELTAVQSSSYAGELLITVYGSPAPQGSKKFVGQSKSGRGLMIESSKKVKPWREAVKSAALDVLADTPNGIEGPVVAEMTFTVAKPKSAPKRRKTYPDRKPDLSKLVRSTEDALTEVGAFEDDARIVETISRKVFPGEHRDALHIPGAVLRLTSATRSLDLDELLQPTNGDRCQADT